jgi:hypothetical protein
LRSRHASWSSPLLLHRDNDEAAGLFPWRSVAVLGANGPMTSAAEEGCRRGAFFETPPYGGSSG